MTSRERVKNAMHFKGVDKVPVRYYYCPVGYYEHGDKLNDLYSTLPGDFSPFERMAIPTIPESSFDAEGRYHSFITDEWGTVWEYRIFGIAGIPCTRPVTAPEDAINYKAPHVHLLTDNEAKENNWVRENQEKGRKESLSLVCRCGRDLH